MRRFPRSSAVLSTMRRKNRLAVSPTSRMTPSNLDYQKPPTYWLAVLLHGTNRARYEVSCHEADPHTHHRAFVQFKVIAALLPVPFSPPPSSSLFQRESALSTSSAISICFRCRDLPRVLLSNRCSIEIDGLLAARGLRKLATFQHFTRSKQITKGHSKTVMHHNWSPNFHKTP